MLTNIKHCIPQNRNILLIDHDIRHEINALSKLKADFRELCITGLLDMFQITSQVLPYFALTLGELLTEVECPHSWLHNAGNDANFTLRALLLLAVRSCNEPSRDGLSCLLNEAAKTPIPLGSPGEEEILAQQKARKAQERAEKMAKRYRNPTRKYQSKLWSVEKQEEIRAERAAKRLLKEEQSQNSQPL